MASMSGQMSTMLWISGAISLLMIALSVAAFVRRLHDSNNSGWWAALAVAAQVVAFALSLSMIGTMQDMMTNAAATGSLGTMQEVQGRMSTYSLIGWIAPLVVIVLGVMGSTAGSNRYGEPQAA